jgi:hypothetical protein
MEAGFSHHVDIRKDLAVVIWSDGEFQHHRIAVGTVDQVNQDRQP